MTRPLFAARVTALSLAAACQGTAPVEKLGSGALEPEKGPDGSIIRRFDLDGDGQPNLWRVFVTEAGDSADRPRERPVRVDLDLNFDGKVDTRRFLDAAGEIEKEEVDLDYDGKVDAVATFQAGVKMKEEVFLTHRQTADVLRLYGDGKLLEKRRDSDGNGVFDVFEYYDSGRLVRIGHDTTGDGQPDKYDERPDADQVPEEEKGETPAKDDAE